MHDWRRKTRWSCDTAAAEVGGLHCEADHNILYFPNDVHTLLSILTTFNTSFISKPLENKQSSTTNLVSRTKNVQLEESDTELLL